MSSFNTRIVTCMYYSRPDSEMGGRSWPEDYYRWTFTNILSIGLPVTVFCTTSEESVAKIQNLVDQYKKNNVDTVDVEIIQYDLKSHPQYTEIVTNRKTALARINEDTVNFPNGFYWTRNEVICHTKLMFLKKTLELHQEVENVVWIDAGITHWGLTPRSLGGREINGGSETYNDFYPHCKTTMFNPSVGNGFNNLVNNHKLILVGHKNNWYDSKLQYIQALYVYERGLHKVIDPGVEWFKGENGYMDRPSGMCHPPYLYTQVVDGKPALAIFSKQIVGGIIGVSREKIDHLYNFYYDHLTFLLTHNYTTLFTEEPILSLYDAIHKPHVLQFTDWLHNVPAEPPNPCTMTGTYEKSFYTIWQDIGNS